MYLVSFQSLSGNNDHQLHLFFSAKNTIVLVLQTKVNIRISYVQTRNGKSMLEIIITEDIIKVYNFVLF
jgi:hypothetical protein